MDPKVAAVVDALGAAGIAIEPVSFGAETRTAADAAAAVGCDVAQIVKSLIFDSEGGPLLFLVSGRNKLDLDRGAAAAGTGSLSRLDADRAKKVTGYSIGATPPIALATDVPVVMDEDLLAHAEVWAAAGRTDSVFRISPRDLARVSGASVAAIAEKS